jgi:hypothetical protein
MDAVGQGCVQQPAMQQPLLFLLHVTDCRSLL